MGPDSPFLTFYSRGIIARKDSQNKVPDVRGPIIRRGNAHRSRHPSSMLLNLLQRLLGAAAAEPSRRESVGTLLQAGRPAEALETALQLITAAPADALL